MKRMALILALCSLLGTMVACGNEDTPLKQAETSTTPPQNQEAQKQEPQKKETATVLGDKMFGVLSLSAANIYFLNEHKNLSDENRSKIAQAIRDNHDSMLEENGRLFEELAKNIEAGKTGEANKIFTSLMDKYVPQSKRDLFAKLNGIEDKDQFESAVSEIVHADQAAATSTPPSQSPPKEESAATDAPAAKTFVNVIAQLDPTEVKEKIKSTAVAEWEKDYRMQEYTINRQTEAYEALKKLSIDSPVKETVLKSARSEWEWDFNMIQYSYKRQMDAYAEIQKIDTSSKEKKEILDAALKEWGSDYNMVLYSYNKQLESYNRLNK